MEAGWDAEGEAQVLSFYALDDAFPDRWPDEEGLALATGSATALSTAGLPEADNPSLSEPPAEGQYVDGDALGIVRNLARIPIANESLKLSSKSFDASLFLRLVHANSSLADLERGIKHLEATIAERTDTLRAMVKNDFDRFVNAKSSIDEICRQMRLGGDANWERGLMDLNRNLYGVTSKAEEVFNPVIERRTRAEKLRLTLALLERWKFFFNLPTLLQQSVRKGKIDVAVRDYQKGYYLMKTTIGFKEAPRDSKSGQSLSDEQRKVFFSVWAEVEDVAANLRNVLLDRLEDHMIPLDEQEKTIHFLLDLNAEDDPAWLFLESRFRFISGRFLQAYNEYLSGIEAELRPTKTHPGSALPPDLEQYLAFLEAARTGRSQDVIFFVDNSLELALWNNTVSLVSSLNGIVNSLLPDFWKLTRDYVEGRLTKNKSGTNAGGAAQAVGSRRKKPAVDVLRIKKCEEMEQHLGTLFSTIISRTFFLHLRNADIRASRRMQSSLSGDRQAFSVLASNSALVSPEQSLPLPPERAATVFNSHPILFCHFLLLLATEWDRCFDRMQALSNSGQTSPFLVQAIARIHEVVLRLVEILCDNFVAETRAIHVYEDWIVVVPNGLSLLAVANPVPVGSHVQDLAARTALLDLFDQFCRYVFSSLHSIAKSTVLRQTSRPAGGEVGTLGGVAQEIKDQARRCLVDSLYFFLDGLERLSFHREVPRLEVTWGKGATGTSAPQNGSGRGDETVSEPFATSGSDGSKRHRVDSGRLDLRILVVLSNLSFFIGKLLPDLTQHLLNVIPGKLADMVQPIYRAAQVLDSMLFDNYVKRKASGLADIMRVGLLFSGLDWFLISRPQEIAAYAYDAIVSLVLIHAEVTAINPLLVHRIIGELWVDIAQTTLDSFRQVDRFSVAGMVQATLETHFLQRSLSNFETDKSRKLIQLVYSCVARGTAHEDKLLAGSNAGKVDKTTGLDALEQIVDDLELQEMLVSVRDYLAEISQTTFNMTKSLT